MTYPSFAFWLTPKKTYPNKKNDNETHRTGCYLYGGLPSFCLESASSLFVFC